MGLTDFEIFDPATARHFAEDDKKALSMEEPYIFFEDVPDAAGNQKQLQTMMNVSHPTMVGLVQRLEANGFVTTAPDTMDRRNKIVSLTEEAEAFINKYEPLLAEKDKIIEEKDKEIRKLRREIQKLRS